LPLEELGETMRPLPIEHIETPHDFLRGAAIVRGEPVPVVDLGALLGRGNMTAPGRFVTLRLGPRRAALAVEEVVGIRTFERALLSEVPPLLRDVSQKAVDALSTFEDRLVLLLGSSRILPDDVWEWFHDEL